MRMNRILLLIPLILAGLRLMAVPANPRPRVFPNADGGEVTLRLVGDEFSHVWLTDDGRMATIDSLGVAHIQNTDGITMLSYRHAANKLSHKRNIAVRHSATTTGEQRGLIVLVNFSDKAFTNTRDAIYRQMNEAGYSDNGATGSARDYFIDQSSEQFKPQFDVVGPVTLDFPCRYYGGNGADGREPNAETMIFSAVLKASQQGLINIADYDNDNDGIVDMAFVIYAGKGEADGGDSNTVWPFMTNMQGNPMFAYQKINGLSLGVVACAAEYRGDGSFSGIGTFCHEYSHCLDLDDLYDVDYSGGYGMGAFDLMSQGSYLNNGNTPAGYSAFERASVGWLQYNELDVPQSVTLSPLNTSNVAYRISSGKENEYFILENRQMQGWDTYLPSRGLMITHIDYDPELWQSNTINDDKDHQHVMLMAADNLWNQSTMTGDLYPGLLDNTSFTDTSTPNSKLWDGTNLGKPVTNIAMNGTTITFDFTLDPSGIKSIQTQNADERTTALYNLSGQQVTQSYKGLIINKTKRNKSINRQ